MRDCTTHHNACECREAKHAKEIAELRSSLNEACGHMDWLSAELVRVTAERDALRAEATPSPIASTTEVSRPGAAVYCERLNLTDEAKAALTSRAVAIPAATDETAKLRAERDHARGLLDRWTKGPAVTLYVGGEPHDCTVLDVGHSDPGLTVECLEIDADLHRLRELVAKLPKTADGVPIIPPMRVWRYHERREQVLWLDVESIRRVDALRWVVCGWGQNDEGYDLRPGVTYSTREAAEAARKDGEA